MKGPESSEIGGRPDPAAVLRAQAAGLTLDRTVALVGLMGAGKTTIGRRLAQALGVKFVDADSEIAAAAGGQSVDDLFTAHGEAAFRRGERAVIARLLNEPPHVLATGGECAFIDPSTRALMREKAITIWLKAPLEVLVRRVSKRDHRPLMKEEDVEPAMRDLLAAREPIYSEADLIIESSNGPHNSAVADIIAALKARAETKAG
ncbi:MAG: shikimate kinase [Hyphomonadaceae bacterium]|nr:shikimate kinase [Hyphomonadaceae bacterium]